MIGLVLFLGARRGPCVTSELEDSGRLASPGISVGCGLCGVFDLFCREMDGHFREAGVSDLKVPKEMQQMAEAFYGRRAVYREALAAPGDDALAVALIRNVYSDQPNARLGAERLAVYVRVASELLSRETELEKGKLAWPNPAAVSTNDIAQKRG